MPGMDEEVCEVKEENGGKEVGKVEEAHIG